MLARTGSRSPGLSRSDSTEAATGESGSGVNGAGAVQGDERKLRKRPLGHLDSEGDNGGPFGASDLAAAKTGSVESIEIEFDLEGGGTSGVNASLLPRAWSRRQQDHGEGCVAEQGNESPAELHWCRMLGIFCFSFTNGTLLGTYLLATLPSEAARIDADSKSIVLGGFIGLAGITQLSGPIAGLLSDRCGSPWGKRRPFMVGGGVFGALGLVLQAEASRTENWVLYAFAFLVSMLALNVIFSSMIGLVPDLVPEHQLGRANGIIAMLSVTGAVAGFGYWYSINGNLNAMYWFYVGLLTVSLIITTLCAHERVRTRVVAPLRWQDLKDCFWVSPVHHYDFFMVFVSRTLYYMGISSQTFFLYYLKDVIGVSNPEVTVGLIAVIGQICGSMTAYPAGFLSDHFGNGRKPYIYASCAIMALGNLAFIGCSTLVPVLVLSGIIGAANGAYLTMDYAIAVDTLPSKEEAARYMGVWGVGAFIGTALGPTIGGPMLYFAGSTDEPGAYSRSGYAMLLVLSAFYLSLGAYLLKYVKGAR